MPRKRMSLEERWTRGNVPTRTLGPEEEWIWGSYINWRRKGTSASEDVGPETSGGFGP